MKELDNLNSKIEAIFNSLEIKYSLMELNDGDLNYEINISTIGMLKPLNSITCMLYFCETDVSSNLLVGNIYRMKDKENLLDIYKKINSVNMSISHGNFFLTDDSPKQIFYKSSINCGNRFSDLDTELIKFQLNAFISALEMLLKILRNKTL